MSFPELPVDDQTTVEATGHVRFICERPLIVLSYAAPIDISRGHRYRVEADHSSAVSRVVFSLGGRAALRPPTSLPLNENQSVALRLRALPSRRSRRIPHDLSRALAEAGASLEHLNEPAAQHLLLMVTEARDPVIRAQRIQIAIEATQQAGEVGP
ncbi:MAG: hypothetical protein M0026_04275 [Nocardiopsaceae bacterium]|nr:hypothetical protein [Nocardiopsaceae bacterium]